MTKRNQGARRLSVEEVGAPQAGNSRTSAYALRSAAATAAAVEVGPLD